MPDASRAARIVRAENQMSYDTLQFHNRALAIAVGISASALSFYAIAAVAGVPCSSCESARELRRMRRTAN